MTARYIHRHILCIAVLIAAALSLPQAVMAFPAETFTTQSALSSGRWVKMSVTETGMHFISAAQLRTWGFSDPTRVTIHGYGGERIPDLLSTANVRDDLPQVATHRTSSGIYFYAVGPVAWNAFNSSGYYVQQLNPFSTAGYYYLTDSQPQQLTVEVAQSTASPAADPIDYFLCRTYHEVDQVSFGKTGTQFFGEDFRMTRNRKFKFTLKDHVEDRSHWMRIVFAANSTSGSTLSATINGDNFSTGRPIISAGTNYGTSGVISGTFTTSTDNIEVGINYQSTGVVKAAHLDAITINYYRYLRLDGGRLDFNLVNTTASLSGATSSTHVWDVTDPVTPKAMSGTLADGRFTWTNPYTGRRDYAAWTEGLTLPSPKLVGGIANQNIHGTEDTPDMIIITVPDFTGEAERLANLHRRSPDNFNVLVISQDDIFNEFSSGSRDPGAFRKMLKMFYDRGRAASHPLRYCILFGRPTFDPRQITDEGRSASVTLMPSWQSAESLLEASSYTTDDIYAMLDDNSGSNISYDRLSIAIGRIPAASLSQAKTYVDKLYTYTENRYTDSWKSTVVLEADNGNEGVFAVGYEPTGGHRTGVDGAHASFVADADASQFVYHKLYYDAYPLLNGKSQQSIELFNRYLDEGIMMWIYNGHGSITTLGDEGLHSFSTLSKLSNKHWPFLAAVTCSFGHWDASETSGIENVCFNPTGGTIGAFSSSRKAQISDNDAIISAIGEAFLRRDSDGQYKRIGDMITDAKNLLRSSSVSSAAATKLRYVTLADPALRLSIPSHRIEIHNIAGESPDQLPQIMARQNVLLEGRVYQPDGTPANDFNGTLAITIYDAERSVTTLGTNVADTKGHSFIYDEKGDKLLIHRAPVTDGTFSTVICMPSEIADNYRPATIALYASDSNGNEALGLTNEVYISGYDETAEPDSIAPVIRYAYLNHPSFTEGSIVNESPMFIAGVSDDIAINLSMAGIGHQMSLKLDNSRAFTDLSLYYTPAIDGSPSGTIAYPISQLSEGEHSLTLRVWDTSGNSASRTINFLVEQGALPQMFEIYSDANPASTHANFYISHNRPEAEATVRLDVYNIGGRHIWSSTVTGQSDMFLSTPITWDLRDMGGQRVPRGIYIYRATLTIDNHELTSPAQRIAVTGH